MTNLDHELKRALQREQPPDGFARRVAAAAATQPPAQRSWWRAAAAAVLLTAIAGGWAAHTAAQRRAGERAKDEVMLALHITSSKVRYAQNQVRDIGGQHGRRTE